MASTTHARPRPALLAAFVAAVFAASFGYATTLRAANARTPTGPAIAILDSGVAPHPDLTGRIVAAHDFVDAEGDPSDTGWHGTAVAGEVAAACPGCTIVSAKVLDAHDAGDDVEIARALLWAVGEGARVVNLSMTGPDEAPALRSAIRAATRRGVVVVAAAGNDGNSEKTFPAADPNVIGVAATSSSGALFRWSNHGSWVTIAALGRATTTAPGGGYSTFVGTSAAAPAVAAAAAQCLAAAPRLSPAAVRRILMRTARTVPAMPFGRLNARGAVAVCRAA